MDDNHMNGKEAEDIKHFVAAEIEKAVTTFTSQMQDMKADVRDVKADVRDVRSDVQALEINLGGKVTLLGGKVTILEGQISHIKWLIGIGLAVIALATAISVL